MYECVVLNKSRSGLIDAKTTSNPNKTFRGINVCHTPGTDPLALSEGDLVVVLSNESIHYIIGKINQTKNTDKELSSIADFEGDLGELDGSQKIYSTDNEGSVSQVIAHYGAGVILDGGGTAVVHVDNKSVNTYADSLRTTTPNMTIDSGYFDGGDASTRVVLKTSVRAEDVEDELLGRDYSYADRSVVVEVGASVNGVSVSIGSGNTLNMSLDGDISASFDGDANISCAGNIIISSGGPSLSLDNDSGDATISSGIGRISLGSDGRVFIGQPAVDLLSIIDTLLDALSSAQTTTLLGAQPLIPLNAVAPVLKAQLQIIKGD